MLEQVRYLKMRISRRGGSHGEMRKLLGVLDLWHTALTVRSVFTHYLIHRQMLISYYSRLLGFVQASCHALGIPSHSHSSRLRRRMARWFSCGMESISSQLSPSTSLAGSSESFLDAWSGGTGYQPAGQGHMLAWLDFRGFRHAVERVLPFRLVDPSRWTGQGMEADSGKLR